MILDGRFPGGGGADSRDGGDDQRTVAPFQSLAEDRDGAAVLFAIGGVAAEVVIEGGVDHRVAVGGSGAQAVEVLDVAPVGDGARGLEGRRPGRRPRQAEHLMAGGQQLAGDP